MRCSGQLVLGETSVRENMFLENNDNIKCTFTNLQMERIHQ